MKTISQYQQELVHWRERAARKLTSPMVNFPFGGVTESDKRAAVEYVDHVMSYEQLRVMFRHGKAVQS